MPDPAGGDTDTRPDHGPGDSDVADGHGGAGHVVVAGLNHLGLRTIVELRRRGERVVAIGAPTDPGDEAELAGARVVTGDFRREAALRAAGVPTASALVLTAEDDHANITAALAAAELNDGIRIVVRMFDPELGSHIDRLLPNSIGLSSSAVAAPGFVAAAIDGEAGEQFRYGDAILTVSAGDAEEETGGPSTIASMPIARLRPDRSVDLLPDDRTGPSVGTPVGPTPDTAGEVIRLVVSGAAEDHHGSIGLDAPARLSLRRLRGWVAGVRAAPAGFRDNLSAPEQRLVRFAAVLLALALVSAVYFEFSADLSPLDALSYALSLLTGASLPTDIDPSRASLALKIYAIVLSMVGAAVVAVVYALITDAIIRSRLLQTLGRRPVPASIRDHVIVCGLGSIGFRIALGVAARGVPVVAVEASEEGRFVGAARAAGIPVVTGDARQVEVLGALGLHTARALVAATSDDLVNLSAALNARAMEPDLRVVVRLFDPEFARRVQVGFRIRFTRSVSHLAAPAFAAASLGAEILSTIPIGDRRVLLVARLVVPDGSPLAGSSVGSIEAAGLRRVVALERPGRGEFGPTWGPVPGTPIESGDVILVAASRAGLAELLERSRPRA